MRVTSKGQLATKLFYYFQLLNALMLREVSWNNGSKKGCFVANSFYYFQLPNILMLEKVNWNECHLQKAAAAQP